MLLRLSARILKSAVTANPKLTGPVGIGTTMAAAAAIHHQPLLVLLRSFQPKWLGWLSPIPFSVIQSLLPASLQVSKDAILKVLKVAILAKLIRATTLMVIFWPLRAVLGEQILFLLTPENLHSYIHNIDIVTIPWMELAQNLLQHSLRGLGHVAQAAEGFLLSDYTIHIVSILGGLSIFFSALSWIGYDYQVIETGKVFVQACAHTIGIFTGTFNHIWSLWKGPLSSIGPWLYSSRIGSVLLQKPWDFIKSIETWQWSIWSPLGGILSEVHKYTLSYVWSGLRWCGNTFADKLKAVYKWSDTPTTRRG
jgi:hypothetical protein